MPERCLNISARQQPLSFAIAGQASARLNPHQKYDDMSARYCTHNYITTFFRKTLAPPAYT